MVGAHAGTPPCVLTSGEGPAVRGSATTYGVVRSLDPMASRAAREIGVAPPEFDALVEWVDRVSRDLVLLEDYSLEEVSSWVAAVDRGVRHHLTAYGRLRPPDAVGPGADALAALRRTLENDHARFRVSLEQLRWFHQVVVHDDHGGNRQALGQYGRVLAEALRRHRDDERRYRAPTGESVPPPST